MLKENFRIKESSNKVAVYVTLLFVMLFLFMRIPFMPTGKVRSTSQIIEGIDNRWEYGMGWEYIDRYLSYGTELYGRLGYDPRIKMSEHDKFYDINGGSKKDLSRAIDGFFNAIPFGMSFGTGLSAKSEEDFIQEIESIKILYGTTYGASNKDFIISFGFYFGSILPSLLIPLVCWIIYWSNKANYNRQKQSKLNKIKSSKYGSDFNSKEQMLNDLRSKNNLTDEEYIIKYHNLIDENCKLIDKDWVEERKTQKQIELKNALESGLITQDEYTSKMKSI